MNTSVSNQTSTQARARPRRGVRWWTLIGVTLGLVLIMGATGTVAYVAGLTGYAPLALAFAPITLALVIIFSWRRQWTLLGFRRPLFTSSARPVLLVALLPVAVLSLSSGTKAGSLSIVGFAGLALLVAFVEESLFRGVLLRTFASLGWIRAVTITSASFALAHSVTAISPDADLGVVILTVLFAFLFGIVAALSTLLTDSILPAMVLHAAFDFAGFILMPRSAALTDAASTALCAALAVLLVVVKAREGHASQLQEAGGYGQ
jgi:membrane protease YdiL (CAAX protease family)